MPRLRGTYHSSCTVREAIDKIVAGFGWTGDLSRFHLIAAGRFLERTPDAKLADLDIRDGQNLQVVFAPPSASK